MHANVLLHRKWSSRWKLPSSSIFEGQKSLIYWNSPSNWNTWMSKKITSGRTKIHGEESTGRPSVAEETFAKVKELMRKDRSISLKALCILVPEVSRSTIHRILKKKLEYRKEYKRWVPRVLTENYKLQRINSFRELLRRYGGKNENFDGWSILDCILETNQQWLKWQNLSEPRKFKQHNLPEKLWQFCF